MTLDYTVAAVMIAALVLAMRPLAVLLLPDWIAGPGGLIHDTDAAEWAGADGDGSGCGDDGGDGGDGGD